MMQPQKEKTKRIKRLDPYAGIPKKARKKIVRLVKLAKINGTIPRSSPQTIPYKEMTRSGLCHINGDFYSRCIEFGDANYKLAKREAKENVFEKWCDFLNYADSNIEVQALYANLPRDLEQYYEAIAVPEQGGSFGSLREEYGDFLKKQLARGNNGLQKRKLICFGVHAGDAEAAAAKLGGIGKAMCAELRTGIRTWAEPLNGYQRMEVMHDILNIGTDRKLNFNWGLIAKTGLTTKDFIAPNSFDFSRKNSFELQNVMGRVSYLRINAPELSDEVLSDFLDMEAPIVVSMHFRSIDQDLAKKQANQLLGDLNGMKADEQQKAFSKGYDIDILPAELKNNIEAAEELIDDLKSRNERMFDATITVVQFGSDQEELESVFAATKQKAQQHGCELVPLDWQQEAGLMSALPLAYNTVDIRRSLITSNLAAFVPFQTQELFHSSGIYYGLNAISNNIIILDRLNTVNPNGLILGIPGSGKSMSAKLEMFIVIIQYDDDVLILDPEREYSALVNALGGQVIKISADSPHHINPLDLNLHSQSAEDTDFDPIRDKCDFVLSFCEQALNSSDGLEPIETSIIDRCTIAVYKDYMADERPENMPTLQNLYDLLMVQPEPEARRIATGLERFVTGSLNVFNGHTNIEIDNRVVCFDTKDLAKNLKKLGMLIVQDQIWSRVRKNRELNKTTRYYADEFHLLLRDAQTASASAEIWKRFRKWGGVPTGITQNVKDFLGSSEIENIFENSDFIYMLCQAPGDQRILASSLGISSDQLGYVTNSRPGHGLLFFRKESAIIPFANDLPLDTQLYRLMSTKFKEITV